MSDSEFRARVQQTVAEALNRHLGSLCSELVEEICTLLGGTGGSASSGAASPLLSAALKSIQEGTTQADILKALLQATESFAPRAVLLVLRAGSVLAWRARGFGGSDPKGATLDASCPLASRALSQRALVTGPAAELDSAFRARIGAPSGPVILVPLLVRDKVAAMLYADAGLKTETADAAALDCLVRFAGAWIELAGARKGNGAVSEAPQAGSAEHAMRGMPDQASDSKVDQSAPASRPPAPMTDPFAASAPAFVAPAAGAKQSMSEADLHKRARRFAKLLVDEIQLYNQEKVEQGRRNADLYARLKAEIEKSRAAYDRRYGESLGETTDYFRQELVRILANNNPALLGSENSS